MSTPETAGEQAAFHDGERMMQRQLGVERKMAQIGRIAIRDFMPEQHRMFFAQLPYLLVGSIDNTGQPSASMLSAAAGFVHSPDPRILRINARPAADDPLHARLHQGALLGLLGIDLHTRRRNRANGRVLAHDDKGFTLAIEQSFGNCPKYVQSRRLEPHRGPTLVGREAECGESLTESARSILAGADMFFIASAYGTGPGCDDRRQGVDVSHRGGRPGFVQVDTRDRLLVPDYPGNRFFNTLGNLLLNSRAGLLFIDTQQGHLLHLDARAEIITDTAVVAHLPGAERALRLSITRCRLRRSALALRWGPASLSPVLPDAL